MPWNVFVLTWKLSYGLSLENTSYKVLFIDISLYVILFSVHSAVGILTLRQLGRSFEFPDFWLSCLFHLSKICQSLCYDPLLGQTIIIYNMQQLVIFPNWWAKGKQALQSGSSGDLVTFP